MNNFVYYSPTEFVFGRDTESQAGELAKKYGAKKVMIFFGKGSVVRRGLLKRVEDSLSKAGLEFFEFGGIQANPLIDKAREGVEVAKRENPDMLMAVGGGSVIDTAKAVAAGYYYDGDVWDFFEKGAQAKEVLNIGGIATTASSGSETSNAAIISNGEWKLGFEDDRIIPKFAIMNPKFTAGLPRFQTSVGVADVLSHLLERYFSDAKHSDTTDYLIEGAIRALLLNADRLIENLQNVNARAEVQWLASVAHNNFLDAGRIADWGSHRIEHELSAQYGITHGEGMAIVFTAWTKYAAEVKPWRLALLASRVFGVDAYDYTEKERALKLSEILETFFKKIGVKTRLTELGISDKDFDTMAKRATRNGAVGHYIPLDAKAFTEVLKLAI